MVSTTQGTTNPDSVFQYSWAGPVTAPPFQYQVVTAYSTAYDSQFVPFVETVVDDVLYRFDVNSGSCKQKNNTLNHVYSPFQALDKAVYNGSGMIGNQTVQWWQHQVFDTGVGHYDTLFTAFNEKDWPVVTHWIIWPGGYPLEILAWTNFFTLNGKSFSFYIPAACKNATNAPIN